MVIIIGTSSPILGKLFVPNPTPPEISFYNSWSMPLAIIIALATVIGQYLFWEKHDWESLAGSLVMPLILTSIVTILSIVLGDVRDLYYMIFRSEEHTSELQSRGHLVCRLLLVKIKNR